MLKTALLCSALLFAQPTDVPVEPNEPEVVEPTFEEKTYVFETETEKVTLTLTSETECKVSTLDKTTSETFEKVTTYEKVTIEDLVFVHLKDTEGNVKLTFNVKEDGTMVILPNEEEKETFFIEFDKMEGGHIEFNTRRGEELNPEGVSKVGDIVELTVENDLFYKINEESLVVTLNDVAIPTTHAKNSNLWTFELKEEGTYKVSAVFDIDNETYATLLEIYENMAAGKWDKVFTVNNIIFIVSALVAVILFIVNLVNKDKGLNRLSEKMMKKFGWTEETKPETIVTDVVNKYVLPLVEDIKKGEDMNRKTVQALTQALLFMQDDSLESKQEIAKMIGKQAYLEEETQAVADEVIKKLDDKKQEEVAKQEETNKKFDAIKEEVKEEPKSEVEYRPVE